MTTEKKETLPDESMTPIQMLQDKNKINYKSKFARRQNSIKIEPKFDTESECSFKDLFD